MLCYKQYPESKSRLWLSSFKKIDQPSWRTIRRNYKHIPQIVCISSRFRMLHLLSQEFEQCFNEYIGQTKRQFGTRSKEHQKAVFFVKKENSALSERNCLTNHTIGRYNSKIITTNRCYHQRLCLEAWHMNSAHAPLNRDDGGLLPDAYLHLVKKKVANQ